MSTVEYRCPVCGHRLFAEPNSPIKYQCPNVGIEMTNGELHPEAIVEQKEEYIGPNFLHKAVGENDPTKTGVITPGIGGEGASTTTPVLIRSQPKVLTPEEELEELRNFWFRLTGTQADRRLKAATLRQEIEDLERRSAPPPEEVSTTSYDEEYVEQIKEEVRAEVRAEVQQEFEELKAGLLADLLAQVKKEQENGNGNRE